MSAEDEELYLDVLNAIVAYETELLGKKAALLQARKAPLDINVDGQVEGFYGEGRKAVDILVSQYETVFGRATADAGIRRTLDDVVPEENVDMLPERVHP